MAGGMVYWGTCFIVPLCHFGFCLCTKRWGSRGSPWALKYPDCHQMITPTHPRGNKRVSEKSNCENSIAFGKSTSQRIFPRQHTP